MNFSADLILKHWDVFALGLWTTIHITVVTLAIGLIIAIGAALSLAYQIPGHKLIRGYIYVFRGTPLLIQLYLIYYGFGQFAFIRESFLWPLLREPYWCALLALCLNTGAYTAEILRGAITATPKGEVEAAKAFGMREFLVIRLIILPSAFRRALPAYSNETIFTLHGTALVSTVQMMDLLGAGRWLNGRYYLTLEGLLTAGVLYALLTGLLVLIFRYLERRLLGHLSYAR